MTATQTVQRPRRLTATQRRELCARIDREGIEAVAQSIGATAETLARAASGALDMRPGTVLLIETSLRPQDPQQETTRK